MHDWCLKLYVEEFLHGGVDSSAPSAWLLSLKTDVEQDKHSHLHCDFRVDLNDEDYLHVYWNVTLCLLKLGLVADVYQYQPM